MMILSPKFDHLLWVRVQYAIDLYMQAHEVEKFTYLETSSVHYRKVSAS